MIAEWWWWWWGGPRRINLLPPPTPYLWARNYKNSNSARKDLVEILSSLQPVSLFFLKQAVRKYIEPIVKLILEQIF